MIQERAELTRSRILQAAAAAFAEYGFAGASLREIVDWSGTTKGGLYFHFGSKHQLAEEIHDRADEVWADMETLAYCREGRTAIQAMIDFTHMFARNLAQDPVFRAAMRLDSEATNPRQRWIPLIHALLAESGAPSAGLEPILSAFIPGVEVLSRRRPDRLGAGTITSAWEALLPTLTTAPSTYTPSGRPHPHADDALRCARPAPGPISRPESTA